MRTLFKTIVVAILPLLVFTGCIGGMGSSSKDSNSGSLPEWFLNPTPSNSIDYSAAGEGSTKDNAKLNALNQIASEISVSVSSNLEVTKKTSNNEYLKSSKQDVKASVDKIKFTDVKIVKNGFFNDKFYVLVSVDRDTLFAAQKKEFEKTLDVLKSTWNHSEANGVFDVLVNSQSMQKDAYELINRLPVLKAINASFDTAPYYTQLTDIIENIKSIKSSTLVYLRSSNAKSYAEVLKSYISAEGIKITNTLSGVNQDKVIKISVSKKAKELKKRTTSAKLKDAKFAKVEITITSTNKSNKTLASNIVSVTNISTRSFADATNKTGKFNNKIEEEGILNIISGK